MTTASPNSRLIVLDDEPGILDAYRFILSPITPQQGVRSSRRGGNTAAAVAPVAKAEPFEVTYAQTGEQTLELIAKGIEEGHPFVGGFFDVKLGPGMDGIETIRRAQKLDPNILCVIVTAYQDRNIDEINHIFGERFADQWDFLTKPFNRGEILQKARNLVSNWERRDRERRHLTQIEAQQEMMVRQERLAAIGTLARGIGHEFGNILLRIIGRAHVAAMKADPKEMHDSLKLISQSAERAGVIVRNLQSLVRMESKRENGEIRAPLQECLDLMDHELKRVPVEVVLQFPENLPGVRFNRVEMGQVFLNLIINASHALEKTNEAKLTFTARAADGGVTLDIADNGTGIEEENLDKIWDPLFTTKGERGSGIGLSVSRKIVENHGGKISVKSQVGKGTTFQIWLPLAKS